MCKMSHLVSEYIYNTCQGASVKANKHTNKTMTTTAIIAIRTLYVLQQQTLLFMTIKLQQEIQETWTCWIHHEVERRKGGTRRSTSETQVCFTQLSIYLACMNSLCVVSSYKRG